MAKKAMAAVCVALSLIFRLFAGAHGHTADRSLLDEALALGWAAFLLPATLPVLAMEQVGFRYAPWADGHAATTTFWLVIAASLFWAFPVTRLMRFFGRFDAFQDGRRRRALLMRGAASALDMMNKRLFGRQRTGGWA